MELQFLQGSRSCENLFLKKASYDILKHIFYYNYSNTIKPCLFFTKGYT